MCVYNVLYVILFIFCHSLCNHGELDLKQVAMMGMCVCVCVCVCVCACSCVARPTVGHVVGAAALLVASKSIAARDGSLVVPI